MVVAIYRTIFPKLTCFVPICLLSSSSGNLACHSQLKTSDWTPPKFGSTSIDWHLDLGCWLFKFLDLELPNYSDREVYNYFIKAVAPILGSEEAAKEKIYLISCNLGCPSFTAEVDKETKDQILVTVEGVKKAIPDYYFDARKKDTRTHVLQLD
ncbi:hypothetical protein IFM89_033323 [Coptis chinensis]|uniref:MORF/ORRM1/DAG-like MORF domain-containing protein n=1 Tax=Coptis chinensis TaxID=261450 RepID=A0A835HLC0_9MAGN|nr:hypothetical protein IFM89_033323 [Coptis chinensis]